jgi:hypothetical protein
MRGFGTCIWLAAFAAFALGCSSSDVNRAIGARCDSDRECDETCLSGGDFPGGFCSLRCESDDDCPDDTRCARQNGQGRCLVRCQEDEDCEYLGQQWDCENEASASGKVCRG